MNFTRYCEGPKTLTIFRELQARPRLHYLLYLADAKFWDFEGAKREVSLEDVDRIARNLREAFSCMGVDVEIEMPSPE